MLRTDLAGNLLLDATPLIISEYDRNAVEEAVRIKERHGGNIVVVSALTWGPISKREREVIEVVREALAIGGDEGHIIIDEGLLSRDPGVTARALARLITKLGGFDLVLTGEASMDMMTSQIASRVAAELGYNIATYARKIEFEDGYAVVTRDLEDCIEKVKVKLPAVISVTGEINEPRLPTLLQIRRAYARPIAKYKLSDFGIESVEPGVKYIDIEPVAIKRKNIIFKGDKLEDIADKLIEKLIEEGVLKGVKL